MTPLRKRMIDDMRIRNYSPGTIKVYVRLVARFATFHTRSPEDLGPEEIRTYQVHLLDQETSWTIFNQSVCALRFLYRVVLQRDWPLQRLPYGKRAKRLPCVLSQDEVRRLLQAVKRPKQRVALATAYATGLRVSEVTRLRVEDIDSERMLVNVHGKGNKERVVMLSEVLHKLKSLKQRLLEAGWLTGKQMAPKLGIKRTTLGRWRTQGRIKARICNGMGEWLYWPPEGLVSESDKAGDNAAQASEDNFTARGAV